LQNAEPRCCWCVAKSIVKKGWSCSKLLRVTFNGRLRFMEAPVAKGAGLNATWLATAKGQGNKMSDC